VIGWFVQIIGSNSAIHEVKLHLSIMMWRAKEERGTAYQNHHGKTPAVPGVFEMTRVTTQSTKHKTLKTRTKPGIYSVDRNDELVGGKE
jgi:hypothetical protein